MRTDLNIQLAVVNAIGGVVVDKTLRTITPRSPLVARRLLHLLETRPLRAVHALNTAEAHANELFGRGPWMWEMPPVLFDDGVSDA